jgi:hypothetical protein
MALEIKSPPVLEGKAAKDFYKTWAKAKESKSKEEAQEAMRMTLRILKNQRAGEYAEFGKGV